MTHRALVVGASQAGARHVEALREIGIDMIGPLSGAACVADPAPLQDASVDVVHVTAANHHHVPLVKAALTAGKHVVCEKPLAMEVEGAAELAALARASGKLATVCHNYRFLPLVVELAGRVRDGELGAVHLARGSFLQDWLLRETDTDWRVQRAYSGISRVVADIGVHWLDLVEWITGSVAESVAADIGTLHRRETEDHAGILVRFSGGLQGACVLSQASAGHRGDLEVSLDGSSASATWRHLRKDELWLGLRDSEAVLVTRDGELRSNPARQLAAMRDGPNEGRRNLLRSFYQVLDGEAPPVQLPTFDDGLRHVRFAAAAIGSARSRSWVDIASGRTGAVTQ